MYIYMAVDVWIGLVLIALRGTMIPRRTLVGLSPFFHVCCVPKSTVFTEHFPVELGALHTMDNDRT